MMNALRAGGNEEFDDYLPTVADFIPGTVPTNMQQLDRLINYQRDTAVPHHHVRWNWIYDLPFGKGHWLAGNAGGFLNRVIGGWQCAGFGSMTSRYFQLTTSNWGHFGQVDIYGTKYKISDCRSGTCIPGYLYYNGYIAANRINVANGVQGVPTSYVPSSQPIYPTPANGGSRSDPNYPYYESNTVWVPLKNGTLQLTTMNNGLNPWMNQYVPAPWISDVDASLFKTIPIKESVNVRFNADFFNVLNMPGLPLPDSTTGIISLKNSAQSARQLQLTLRLVW